MAVRRRAARRRGRDGARAAPGDLAAPRPARRLPRSPRLIRELRPQILHTHTAKAGRDRPARRSARRRRRGRRSSCTPSTATSCAATSARLQSDLFRLLEHWLARRTTALIAVSPEVRDDLVALGVAPAEKFTVVRLGIELQERVASLDGDARGTGDAARCSASPPDRFVVGWIGRMTAVKRTDDVLLAFAPSARPRRRRGAVHGRRRPRPGDASSGARRELGIVRSSLFLGYQEDVAPYYAAFDALILPSANEGTPVSAIEPLAGGRPVVATDVGGVPDVVRDGVDGFLVAPGDVDAMADRLARLAADADLRRRMGEAGSASVRERYSVERLLDDVDRLISLVACPHSGLNGQPVRPGAGRRLPARRRRDISIRRRRTAQLVPSSSQVSLAACR